MRELILIIHILSLILSLGSMTTFIIIRKDISRVSGCESNFALITIRKFLNIAYIGMFFMVLSGLYLIIPFWSAIGTMPLVHIKITAVVLWLFILILLGVSLKRIKPETYLSNDVKIGLLSFLSVLFGLIVVALAIFAFE